MKNSNCEGKTQKLNLTKLKLWQNSKSQIMTKTQKLWRLVQLIRQEKLKTNKLSLFLCKQLAFLSEKLILRNKYEAQVLAFLSILQASREAKVREEQKERKMAEMFYFKEVWKIFWILEGIGLQSLHCGLYS